MSSPNQWKATIHTYTEEQKEHNKALKIPYSYMTQADKFEAMRRLSPVGYMLFEYLACNADGFPLELSPQAVENKTGMTKGKYREGVKSLQKNGYLVWEAGNMFSFYVKPKEPRTKPTKAQKAAQEKRAADVDSMIADCASYISGGHTPQRQQEGRRRSSGFDYDGMPFDF